MARPYYITTAINYPNGKPHVGHAYEAVAADVIARFHRLIGDTVRFQTGTDEHGLKMAQKARDNGVTPAALADEMAAHFIDMAERLNISHDRFLRTTEPEHHRASQTLWQRMEANGDLYLGHYAGWYSVRDEAYYGEEELTKADDGTRLSPQGTPVEWTEEASWFFRLSKYQQPLLDLYNSQPDFIQPASRRNEVMRFVEGGLSDLSVSRTSFDWGVPVPGQDGHVMYVWVDALTNYLTGLGFPDEVDNVSTFWPAALHVIGKDIVRFHAVYWPAFLMSAGIAVPQRVFGHGFLLHRGEKMSKSSGNVVDPMALAELVGVDPLRYYFTRAISFGEDGSYSEEAIATTANADLSNSFGNLAQRVLSMTHKNLGGVLSVPTHDAADSELLATVRASCAELAENFARLDLSFGVEAWLRGVFACNQYVDVQAPWTLRKTDPERMTAVLMTLLDAVRMLATAISPVVPDSATKLLDALGVTADDRTWSAIGDDGAWGRVVASGHTIAAPVPLFPRIDLDASEQVATA